MREDRVDVQLPVLSDDPTMLYQMVDVMTDWGVDSVFDTAGTCNLWLADAESRSWDSLASVRHIGPRRIHVARWWSRFNTDPPCAERKSSDSGGGSPSRIDESSLVWSGADRARMRDGIRDLTGIAASDVLTRTSVLERAGSAGGPVI